MHFRPPPPANVPPLPRAQDVRLAQPDPAAAEGRRRPRIDLGRFHDDLGRFRGRRGADVGRPQERVQRAGRHRQGCRG